MDRTCLLVNSAIREYTQRQNLHVHEVLHALVQISLLQSNTDRNQRVGSSALCDPAGHGIEVTLLVNDILACGNAQRGSHEAANKDGGGPHFQKNN